jgi:hypothetical protein
MFKLLSTLWKRVVVDDAPAAIDKCLECDKLGCSESEFQACTSRKQRQADIEGARSSTVHERRQ